jgi:hypothetical protein
MNREGAYVRHEVENTTYLSPLIVVSRQQLTAGVGTAPAQRKKKEAQNRVRRGWTAARV